jgi:hypothetical protein
MRKVLLAMLALFALSATPMVFAADNEPLPEITPVDDAGTLPPLTDSADGK